MFGVQASWYLTDRQGSVRNLTDSSENLQDTITYDPFGNVLSESNAAYGDRYKYTGRELDAETNLQYNRARYYDTVHGRFISQDPLGFAAGDSNLYRYAGNGPTNGTDPSGLTPIVAHPDGWDPAGSTLQVLPAVTGPDGSMEPGGLALPAIIDPGLEQPINTAYSAGVELQGMPTDPGTMAQVWISPASVGAGGAATALPAIMDLNGTTADSLVHVAFGYREDFKEATPAMPDDWDVHHTLPQQEILKKRFKDELGINVDELDHLRGLPPGVHKDVRRMQQIWEEMKMRELGILGADEVLNNTNRKDLYRKLWERVNLSDVQKLAKQLEQEYAELWIKAGEDADQVARINRLVGSPRKLARFKLGQAGRIAKLFPKLIVGLGLLLLIKDNVAFAANIADHSPEQQAAWQRFEDSYRDVIDTAVNGGQIDHDSAERVRDNWRKYWEALGADQQDAFKLLDDLMANYIDVHYPAR